MRLFDFDLNALIHIFKKASPWCRRTAKNDPKTSFSKIFTKFSKFSNLGFFWFFWILNSEIVSDWFLALQIADQNAFSWLFEVFDFSWYILQSWQLSTLTFRISYAYFLVIIIYIPLLYIKQIQPNLYKIQIETSRGFSLLVLK